METGGIVIPFYFSGMGFFHFIPSWYFDLSDVYIFTAASSILRGFYGLFVEACSLGRREGRKEVSSGESDLLDTKRKEKV
jgi:hypothetical protein